MEDRMEESKMGRQNRRMEEWKNRRWEDRKKTEGREKRIQKMEFRRKERERYCEN